MILRLDFNSLGHHDHEFAKVNDFLTMRLNIY